MSYINHKRHGKIPHEAKTTYYNYVARNPAKKHILRFCSQHEEVYNSDRPWHIENHRHKQNAKVKHFVLQKRNKDNLRKGIRATAILMLIPFQIASYKIYNQRKNWIALPN